MTCSQLSRAVHYIWHRQLVMTRITYGHRYLDFSHLEEALASFFPMTTG